MEDSKADIGVIGLAVMGQNLILNMADHGFRVAAFNRTTSKVDEFLNNQAKNSSVIGAHSMEELIGSLKSPKRIMLMVKAGQPVDETIDSLLPYLSSGDVIIDGGNSLFSDTERRLNSLKEKAIFYIGCGISGGEEGARHGPAIMPGGSEAAWPLVSDIFTSIAAKGLDDLPCCQWLGSGGVGHFVKMVHNGIEYGDMQLIAEAYAILKLLGGLSNDALSQQFKQWNEGDLNSYLIEITADILKFKDQQGNYVIDHILDSAGQKGTGKWTVINASELSQPASVIAEALFARFVSSLKIMRVKASQVLQGPTPNKVSDDLTGLMEQALYAGKLVSYAQGYMMMRAAANDYSWNLDYAAIAQIWTGGCIIRSRFLGDIKHAYSLNPNLDNLLLDEHFATIISQQQAALRQIVSIAALNGLAVPALSAALSFYDSFRSSQLPANLIQAQRDYFGAHTYQSVDDPNGAAQHTNWTGQGGQTTSSTYSV